MGFFFGIVNALLLCAFCVSHSWQYDVKTGQRASGSSLDNFGSNYNNGYHHNPNSGGSYGGQWSPDQGQNSAASYEAIQSVPSLFCSGKRGLYPHPNICDHYVNCINSGMDVLRCSPGKAFNPQFKTCEEGFKCEQLGQQFGSNYGGQSGSNYGGQAGSNYGGQPVPNYGGQSGSNYGGQSRPNYGGQSGSNYGGQSVPNYGGQSGSNYSGQSRPNYGGQSGSNYGGQSPPSLPESFCTGNYGLQPHPNSCQHYVSCTRSKSLEILTCKNGKLFNPRFKICDTEYRCTLPPTNPGNANYPGQNAGQFGSNYGGQSGSHYGGQSGSNYGGQSGSNYTGQPVPNYGGQFGSNYSGQSGSQYGGQTVPNYGGQSQPNYGGQSGSNYGGQPVPNYGGQSRPNYGWQNGQQTGQFGHPDTNHQTQFRPNYAEPTRGFESSSHTDNSQSSSTVSASFCLGKTGLHAHPGNCDHYVKCENGAPVMLQCSAGKLFNPNFKICEENYNCQLPSSRYSGHSGIKGH